MPNTELCLRATNIHNSKVTFRFILRDPKHLMSYDVQSPNLNFQGHQWFVTCRRNGSHMAMFLGWQVHSINTECHLDFSFAIINRKDNEREYVVEKEAWFTHKERLHGVDRLAKLPALLDGKMGFRSTLSDWIEIELTVWNCSTRSSMDVSSCSYLGTSHISTDVLTLGTCRAQLQFYAKGKPTTKHEGKPCFYLHTPQIPSGLKFKLSYECMIEQEDVRYTTGGKSAIFNNRTVKEHPVPSQQLARFGGSPTFSLLITSVSLISDITLKLSRDMNTIRAGTFTDGEGGHWKIRFIGGERAGLTLALAPCPSSLHTITDISVLHWKGAFMPRRQKQDPLPLNDDKIMCATTACQQSHVTEFRLDTSLNTTKFITSQYLQNKRLVFRVEILKVQQAVMVPQPHDMMVNLELRSTEKLLDKVQQLEEENARLLLELQDLKSLQMTKTQGVDQTTQVNQEDFRRPSSTSSHPASDIIDTNVTEEQLDNLAGNLGHNWKRLAIKLNFKYNELEQIEEETSLVRERIFSMLYRWKRRTRRGSTIGRLVDALKYVDEDYEAYRFLLDR